MNTSDVWNQFFFLVELHPINVSFKDVYASVKLTHIPGRSCHTILHSSFVSLPRWYVHNLPPDFVIPSADIRSICLCRNQAGTKLHAGLSSRPAPRWILTAADKTCIIIFIVITHHHTTPHHRMLLSTARFRLSRIVLDFWSECELNLVQHTTTHTRMQPNEMTDGKNECLCASCMGSLTNQIGFESGGGSRWEGGKWTGGTASWRNETAFNFAAMWQSRTWRLFLVVTYGPHSLLPLASPSLKLY